MNLYEELGLNSNATLSEIKQRYRELAQIYHPDKGGDEEKFKRISLAYEILSDPIRRKNYDENKNFDDKPSLRSQAVNQLSNLFFSVIQNYNCVEGNLIETLKTETERMKQSAINDSVLCKKYIYNLEIAKQKLKIKDSEKEDIILSFLELQINTRKNEQSLFEHRIELTNEMLNILENYTYGFLEIPKN
jgi:curved DNA-binding protein CbpA